MDKLYFCLNKIKKWWIQHPLLASVVVFVVVFLLYASIYFSNPGISTIDDHFFHFKYAYLLRTDGWQVVNNFDWIYFTKTAQENSPYSVSLFQIAVMPFTFFQDKILGLKINDIFWASLSISLIYYVLRKIKTRFPLFSILILMTSTVFIGRMLSGRAFVLIVGLFFLEIYLALEKKYFCLFMISLFHVLWHQSTFFLPILAVTSVEMGRYLEKKEFYYKNFIYGFSSIFLGLLFFPDLWRSIKGLFSVQFSVAAGNLGAEGQELYILNPLSNFWGNSEFFLLITFASAGFVVFYYILSKREVSKEKTKEEFSFSILMYALFISLIAFIFGSISISGRFYDFYFPASIIFGSVVLTKILNEKMIIMDNVVLKYIGASIIMFFIFSAGNAFLNERVKISKTDYRQVEESAEWIKSKSKEKELVFLQNWGYFPTSFFFNSKNAYTMGIEPSSLLIYKPKLYWEWYNIFKYTYYCEKEGDCGEEKAADVKKYEKMSEDEKAYFSKENSRKIINSIKNDFKSKFIISDSSDFNETIALNQDMIKDSLEVKSEMNDVVFKAFQLK
jgi:hypothetical protein